MKYYFINDTEGKRHIVVANNVIELASVLSNADISTDSFFELKEDTFANKGFLISDK